MGRRIRAWGVLWAATAAILAAASLAAADAYDPPATYYNAATGTGGTLLTQLRTIVTDMEPVTYGEARDSAVITDADPNVAGNILLIYNRASINGEWDSAATWDREHIWPQSRLGASASNGTANIASDQFNIRPCNPPINSNRGNTPFGLDNSTGTHGSVGSYYYPGDADAGDVARSQFYMATRWSALSLTDSTPSGLQMGDLSSLVAYHFRDVPDAFERRRNHAIYGLAGASGPAISNPYRQENRNPYVDHPEWVWSVFVDQANDSQISIAGATIGGDGGSTRNVDLGRVFVGGAVPAAQNFTLNKGGSDGTYYEVTAAGAATSSVLGRTNAFRTNMIDSKSITIGLNTTTATAGLKSGTVAIDNLDITTSGGAGHGANDANDLFNVSLSVLDHATPSFDGNLEDGELVIDFGTIEMGDPAPSMNFDIFNFAPIDVYTANLDFDSFSVLGDGGAFATDLGDFDGLLLLAADASHTFMASLSSAAEGIFEATYTLNFSDEDIAGALTSSLTLTLMGEVTAGVELLAGDYNLDGVVDAVDYTVWRNTYGTTVAAFEGADGDGDTMIDDDDFGVWRDNYGNVAPPPGSGGLASTAVPEPATALLISIGLLLGGAMRRR